MNTESIYEYTPSKVTVKLQCLSFPKYYWPVSESHVSSCAPGEGPLLTNVCLWIMCALLQVCIIKALSNSAVDLAHAHLGHILCSTSYI